MNKRVRIFSFSEVTSGNLRIFLVFSFLLVFLISFAFAANVTTCAEGDNNCKVNNAYSCLQDEITKKKCSNLTSEEKVFSMLATGLCKNEVKSDAKYRSDVKYTAQATILLGKSDSELKKWLISQNRTSTGIDWYLEIESPKATTCTVSYSGGSATFSINEDKTILSLSSNSCFSLSTGNYWLKIDANCYAKEFETSCNQQFLTTLLYQKQNSETIYVTETTHSSSASGSTKEKVNSFCFKKGVSCDYETTLWAAFALSSVGEKVTAYLPYLTVMADENTNLLPESFLYHLSGNADFKNQLLSKQINNKWWLALNDRYYGTAQALMPLKYEESPQKSGATGWLFNEAQEENGCWNSANIKNTAFLLYSMGGRNVSISDGNASGTGIDCTAAGYFCTSQINCAAQALPGYSCSGAFVCCSQNIPLKTCTEQGGIMCASNQVCTGIGAVSTDAADATSGQKCCVQGTCQTPTTGTVGGGSSSCEIAGGTCRVSGCLSGESETSDSCDFSTDSCCVTSTSSGKINYMWIAILLVLIALVVAGIIFREKLQMLLLRMKSKFRSGGSTATTTSRPGFPPFGSSPYQQRPPLRRVLPASNQRPRPMPRSRSQSEVDDVLKKLKDMSK
ncbi:hypothetical protein HYT24_00600 [Candidatus Pacearchaeota archaeon]|nr:hypothetical protein [Candidatus Pacearchaeota archaeon]